MTCHLDIANAIMDALRADPLLVDGPIARGRAITLPRQYESAVGVRLVRSGGQRVDFSDGRYWTTAVAIECAKRAGPDEDPQAAVDALVAEVYARVCNAALPKAAEGLPGDPEIHWDTDEADPSVGLATLIVRANHLTARASLAPMT